MAVVGSGVIPRKATLEAPVLPANRRSSRQPPGRTRASMPLTENHTSIRPPNSGPGPLFESRRPGPRSCGRYFVLERAPCGAGPTAPQTPRSASRPGRHWRSPHANAVVREGDSARLHPWHRHSPHDDATVVEAIVPGHGLTGCGPAVGSPREAPVRCPTEAVARPVTVGVARTGSRITRAMQPSAARGKTSGPRPLR